MNCLIHPSGMSKNINYFLATSAETRLPDCKLVPDPVALRSGKASPSSRHGKVVAAFLKGSE